MLFSMLFTIVDYYVGYLLVAVIYTFLDPVLYIFNIAMSNLRILVPVKRVLDYTVGFSQYLIFHNVYRTKPFPIAKTQNQ